ncbi:Stk1 family PASTA domain-containing Ser/Thr kinase [Corynebacterium sp. HS2168-gen11]|uniref:Stk1 family PASTA domain-containing Ser/Thr kinase n=1 Tax=Corynebacterium sp. HS2168-gen11 TaxID=2974027 RepID=UPI00216B231C|nr:Stk1 family PASTA domain-containing Ser/Thr kinase [Corynebacterium sp. HS2168-gen11]MCS4536178.1 Stk1 family PASTA domain-containing Ser/Thr kinase [Corynebacterium sp. HS2168-gen11]
MQLSNGYLLENRYRVEATIARGGMSYVYRCVDLRLGRLVAAKVMTEQYQQDPVFQQRFRREARSLANLRHPNLIDVYDFSAQGDEVFLIMELITGGTLRELLAEQGPLPVAGAVEVMRQILQGLAAVHEAGMVHRDIKPDNVLISASRQIKLSDFGLVRGARADHNQSSQIIGTVKYLSPEQARDDVITPASDVYSAGILLFELLTGGTPFSGNTPLEHARQRLSMDVPAPSNFVAGIPPLVDELVANACNRNPQLRFEDAGEFLAALDDIAAALALGSYQIPLPVHSAAARAAHVAPNTGESPTEMFTTAIDATSMIASTPVTEKFVGSDSTSVFPSTESTSVFPRAERYEPTYPPQPPAPAPPHLSPQASLSARTPQTITQAPVRNSNRLGLALWLFFVALCTGAVLVAAWWFGSGRYGEVPQVLGLERTAAVASLEAAGFQPAVVEQYHDELPPDVVIDTQPSSGERAALGQSVSVMVSLGKPVVPDFHAIEHYDQLLADHTLVMNVGPAEYSNDVEEGQIARVEPPVGTEVLTQSAVTVFYSLGPAPVQVPSVYNLPADKARQILEDAGFKVSVEKLFDGNVQQDHAINSQPDAGTELPFGADIVLRVSTAKEVPDVTGLTEQQARETLAQAGIQLATVKRTDDKSATGQRADEIYTLTPAPGTLIDADRTKVTLELVNKVHVPNVIGQRVDEATQMLQDAGFKVKVEDKEAKPEDTVLYQSPSFLSSRQAGTTVSLSTF